MAISAYALSPWASSRRVRLGSSARLAVFATALSMNAWALESGAGPAAHADVGGASDAAVQGAPEPSIPVAELPEAIQEDVGLGWTLLRTMLVLGIVLALVYLTLNVGLRKLLGIKPVVGASVVTVLERVVLDQRRSLFVVEAAGEMLLIGGSENSLTLLSKLDRAQVERARAARPPVSVPMSPFLKKLLGRRDDPPPPQSGS